MNRIFFRVLSFFLVLSLLQCKETPQGQSIPALFDALPGKVGKQEYLGTPYVTAGDRLYMVGHQDGSFPDIGWHVEGEMGGIWDHPIKLMDGFAISIKEEGQNELWCLDKATQFVNYPVGNKHIFERGNLRIERMQFVPDRLEDMVIELSIRNKSKQNMNLEIGFTGMIDLMPVWLSDSLGIADGEDTVRWDNERKVFIASDANNDWFAIFGSSEPAKKTGIGRSECSVSRRGKRTDATITSAVSLQAGSGVALQYYISGSDDSREDALRNYERASSNPASLLKDKISRYKKIKGQSDLTVPDKEIQEMYTWLKYNTDWLIRDVEGIGRGVSAGIPDYPWWFAADNAYTLQGLLATGQFDEVFSTVDLLYRLSGKVNDNGRMIHEASTNGVVFNKGNMNETPHIIWLLWKIYEWTGDKAFLERYYTEITKGIDFLLNERDEDGNLYPNGHGMMEIRGLDTEMIDVAVYTQQALWAAAKIAGQLGKSSDRKEYRQLADELAQKINTEWWVADFNSYADFRATQTQALALVEDAIIRADTLDKPWAVEELKNAREKISGDQTKGVDGYVVHHNWVVNTPMEMGIADITKAEQALATARNYTSRFGMYVTGIDRDEGREESSKWEVFSYVGAVMTLPTGVQAIAEANYGNIEESFDYLEMLSNSFGYALPGSMYEVSPDYGMIVQAWNIYSVAVPVVEHYFGVKPRAYEKKIIIRPQMPESWDNVSLDNVRVGDNAISISKKTGESSITYQIEQEQAGWVVDLQLSQQDSATITVNGETIEPDVINDLFQIRLNKKFNMIIIESGSNR